MKTIKSSIALAAACVGAVVVLACVSESAAADDFGKFLDELNVQFVDGGKAKLLNDFRYQDHANLVWTAKRDYETDGASIPQVFWSVVGGPFDGALPQGCGDSRPVLHIA